MIAISSGLLDPSFPHVVVNVILVKLSIRTPLLNTQGTPEPATGSPLLPKLFLWQCVCNIIWSTQNAFHLIQVLVLHGCCLLFVLLTTHLLLVESVFVYLFNFTDSDLGVFDLIYLI